MREAENAAHCSHLHKSPLKERSDRWPSGLNHTFEANSTLPLGRRHPSRRFRSRTTSIHHLTLSPVWGHWGNWGYWAPLPAATGERQEQTHSLGSPSTLFLGCGNNWGTSVGLTATTWIFQNLFKSTLEKKELFPVQCETLCIITSGSTSGGGGGHRKTPAESQMWKSVWGKKKRRENERMRRAREDGADRYCGLLFFTLWNSDVLAGDCLGRGEMDGYKMGKKTWNTRQIWPESGWFQPPVTLRWRRVSSDTHS